jgi:hypothetical protein
MGSIKMRNIKNGSVGLHEVVVLDLAALLLVQVGVMRASCGGVGRFLLLFVLAGIVAIS